MKRKRLLWQLYPSYLLITLVLLATVAIYAAEYGREFYYKRLEAELTARARVLGKVFSEVVLDTATVDPLCKEYGRLSSTRITVVQRDGKVLGDSEENPATMEPHAQPDRPEIVAALQGRVEPSIRYSHTLRIKMMYVAVPLEREGNIVGVVRTALSLSAIERGLHSFYVHVGVAGLLIALLGAGVSYGVARRIARPLEEIRRGAERYAQGDLTHKLPVYESLEIGSLAEAMNRMGAQMDERLRAIIQQRNELETVLSGMVEGVLAVDADERVLKINQAAGRMLGVDISGAHGRSIQEVVRHAGLQQFVARALRSAEPIEADLSVNFGSERALQARGAPLHCEGGECSGAVIVLNDVTRLRQLENLRREFVANVSHELKTPVTSIKGFVETLQDGAMENPEDARRFLGIIAKHAERLQAIIEDLLSLSRIEQEGERREILLERGLVRGVVQAAVQACRLTAEAKQIRIETVCEESLYARVNSELLEQAIVNLLDNAIKYSEPGSVVEVAAQQANGDVTIAVRDYGCGIPKEHLPRIFERFYRVDKARSRKLGGTGLGLAIVKHIVQAHGGQVSVESAVGKGSTFTIRLPGS
ncbi:MAG: cell wall metabolism sensor histidine kinase WalK [Candidatus Sumerlaeia bacterium]|nr:cell wall metabolism sensor histidine kinase WalK [Candidatus Sumerlaeia bacterium]